MDLIGQLALLLCVGVSGGIIALKLKTPLVVGYIMGGAVLALFMDFGGEELKVIENLAEVGVALLLFSIGLEFSVEKMLSVKKYAIIGGLFQIVITIVFGLLIFPMLGFTSYEAFFLGSVFSFSSTAVVVKILDDIGLIETYASQITVGWLILQDIAVVFLIILLGNFSTGEVEYSSILLSLLKSFLLIALALIIGNKLINRILKTISGLGSKEILVVTAFAFCLMFAFLAESIVGSFTLGAFLAGLMISESFLHHEIFSEIKPLQSIFSLFFFIIIGSLFSVEFLISKIFIIFLLLLFSMVLKGIITVIVALALKMHIRNAIEVGINLAQVGEFAFLSASIGLESEWISSELHSLIIAVTIVSLLITPLLISKVEVIYESLREFFHKKSPKIYRRIFMAQDEKHEHLKKLHNHIIVCGYGRVGKYIAMAVKKMNFRLLLIDFDKENIELAAKHGINSIYGDATSEEILLEAGIEKARAIIIALPKEVETMEVVKKVNMLNRDVKIIIRRSNRQITDDDLKGYSVIEPEFEAALKIVETILPFLGKRDKKVIKWLREQKEFLY